MPSTLHEILIELFRENMGLAPKLVAEALNMPLPPFSEVQTEDAQLTEMVALLMDKTPVCGIVIEVQLQHDDDKRFSWPLYAAALRSKFRCPVDVSITLL